MPNYYVYGEQFQNGQIWQILPLKNAKWQPCIDEENGLYRKNFETDSICTLTIENQNTKTVFPRYLSILFLASLFLNAIYLTVCHLKAWARLSVDPLQ